MIDDKKILDYLRVKNDPIEFLSLCKLNDAATHKVINFILWPHLVEFVNVLNNEQYVIVLKSKQLGFSHAVIFDTLHKALTQSAYVSLLLSAGERESQDLLEKGKTAWEYLPNYLRLKAGKWSESEITFPDTGAKIESFPSTSTPGLGKTASRAVLDEWDFHKYPDQAFATAQAAASAANAQLIGLSTINKRDPESLFKKLFKQARAKQNKFCALFYPWSARPDRDDEWYQTQKFFYIDRPEYMEENFPTTEEEALSPASVRSFFDKDVLERLSSGVQKPLETRENVIFIYQRWRPGCVYVAASDVSQGQGGDAQCLVVLGKSGMTSEVVAIVHSNLIRPDTFAYMTTKLLEEYKNPVLAGESNPIGVAYLQELQRLNYPNLYYADKVRNKVGWVTTTSNRETTLLDLATSLRTGEVVTRYEPMVKEMFNFQRTDSGKVEAVGGHDDTVMALAIANQLMRQAGSPVTKRKVKHLATVTTRGMYR